MTTLDDTVTFAWFVDSVPQASVDDTLVLQGSALGLGTFEVTAVVTDATPLVRNDPSGSLTATTTWFVTTTSCGDGAVQAPEVCDDGNRISGDGCSADCSEGLPPPPALLPEVKKEGCDCAGAISAPLLLPLLIARRRRQPSTAATDRRPQSVQLGR